MPTFQTQQAVQQSKQAQGARFGNRSWKGTAFIIEALVLLIFVAGALAVLLSIFVQSYNVNERTQSETDAILLATNAAEAFSAAPAEGTFVAIEGDYVARNTVQAQSTSSGIMYQAHIEVYSLEGVNAHAGQTFNVNDDVPIDFDAAQPIYELTTARYVSREVS